MKNEEKYLFEEAPSKEHRAQIFNAVQKELELNKSKSKASSWAPWSIGLSFVFVGFIYFQFLSPVHQNTTDLEQNLIMELAALSPDEIEIIEDLDFIEALDEMSDKDIREITL